mmetsp:Transcript_46514/g.101050  ORF Transcript_46514/g.101050 Transcript_46514/m.101050 type:complete len:216 (-) Transcript_46514:146-793(-)
MSDAENKVDIEGCLEKVWEKRTTRKAQTLLKALSLLSGAFMIVAGIIGCSFILYFQIVYFIGSLYTIIFGLTVLTLELRDKLRVMSAVYCWIDIYLKFLTLQRGKGAFYWFVGLLILFISPDGTEHWGPNNCAALVLAFVGFLHTFLIIKETEPVLGPGAANFEEPVQIQAVVSVGSTTVDSTDWTPSCRSVSADPGNWTGSIAQTKQYTRQIDE